MPPPAEQLLPLERQRVGVAIPILPRASVHSRRNLACAQRLDTSLKEFVLISRFR